MNFRTITTLTTALLALVLPHAAFCASTRLHIADPDALNAVIDEYVEEKVYPFMYLRLEDRDGAVIHDYAAVNGELMDGRTVDGDSWIRIWSMSKIVTISVVLDLVEDGVLELSDRVVEYIPEFEKLEVAVSASGDDLSLLEDKTGACPLETVPAKYGMTVLDLLNHRAGFYYPETGIDCLDDMAAGADLPASADSQELIDRMAGLPLINQPGTTYYYGTGITVLGLLAERATGKSLQQLVAERITGPLGIEGLQYGLPPGASLFPRFHGADGEVKELIGEDRLIFGTALPDYDPAHELYLGGEGMIATADGYADFARMLLRGGELNGYRFLDTETLADLVAPHTQLESEFGHNGYNFWISNGRYQDGEQGPGPLWIGGGYEGTYFWIDPDKEFVAVIMTQSFNIPERGWGRDEAVRRAVYEQLRSNDPASDRH
jgi:CubicO group peptidase (beta-lactamase class C family)